MSIKKKINRRELLKGTGTAILGTLLARCAAATIEPHAQDPMPSLTPKTYLPLVKMSEPTPTPTPTPTPKPAPAGSLVVHAHDPDATNWAGSGWYGDAVDQGVVDHMVQAGLQELTGTSSWVDIWDTLFSQVQTSGYQSGQKIALKVSFNNSWNGGCSGSYDNIDALPQPVEALVAGLVEAGVNQNDIWIYDATVEGRIIPDRFRAPILSSYPNVQFYGKGDCDGVHPVSHGADSSLTVQFSDPHGNLSDRKLTDVLYEATYVINMPILKKHSIAGVSLGFKNHFGSINNISRGDNDDLHNYVRYSHDLYSSTYNPMVDIFRNSNIKDKTVLTVGDGLYGAFGATRVPPTSWDSFGDAPNSLLFSADPVAIDCVMIDLLAAEGKAGENAYHYLFIAQDVGLGTCEGIRSNPGGDPWQTPYGSGYSNITYRRLEL